LSWTARICRTEPSEYRDWEAWFQRLPSKGIYHSPAYMRFLAAHTRDEAELFVYGDIENYVYYPYFKRTLSRLPFAGHCDLDLSVLKDIVSSWYYGGPIVRTEDHAPDSKSSLVTGFLDAFRNHCRSHHMVSEFIRFDPNLENCEPFRNELPVKYKWDTIYVDLARTEEQIWTDYQGRCRTAVRKGRNFALSVHEVDPGFFLSFFPDMYRDEMTRKNAPPHYRFGREFFEGLIASLQDQARLFAVRYGEEIVGGTICLFEPGGVAYDYLTATSPNHWKYQINNVLFDEVIRWCKRGGALIFDFHGGRDSVAFFKAGFSSFRGSFHVAEIVHDQDVYDELVRAKKAYAKGQGGAFFPDYRVKDTN
jgi:serine/alanine adding enzyme